MFIFHFQIRFKSVQTLCSIIQHPEKGVSTPFIHVVAPLVIEYLLTVSKARPTTDIEAQVTTESIKMLATLVNLTDEQNSKYYAPLISFPNLLF